MNKSKDKIKAFRCLLSAAMKLNYENYFKGESGWIDNNIGLVIRFFEEAEIDRIGKRYRSQKEIIEYLRHRSSARDSSRGFKINNDCAALLATLYNDCLKDVYFTTKTRSKGMAA